VKILWNVVGRSSSTIHTPLQRGERASPICDCSSSFGEDPAESWREVCEVDNEGEGERYESKKGSENTLDE